MADEEHWLRKNWSTLAALLMIFGLAFFLRTYFVYGAAMPDRLYSGGSDSFYHEAIIRYAYQTGHQLTFDPLLNYPLGLTNPRPPLFQWWALLSGYVISPAFATPWDAITFSFILTTALFGSLTIFPLFALVKEAFDRRAGLIAAFLLAVSPGHLQRSVASNSDHDAFVLFFVVIGYFFFFRALATLNEKRWVESWRSASAIRAGLGLFFRENRAAVLYSLLSGIAVAAVALTWQGWAYAPIILLVYFVFQLFFHRIRNKDTLGITVAFGITMATALLIAAPWYFEMNQVKVWFDVPAYLFGAAIGLALLLTVSRDYPWALVLPTVLGASSIALGVGTLLNPSLANAFVSGAGYFVQTKLYETIAEAQAPPISQIILSFGWGTYFLSWGALVYLLWQSVSGKRTQTAYLFVVVWTLAAIIMAQAAARFIFNASPAFAATAGYAIGLIIQRLDFDGMKRTYASVAAGSRRAAIRKSVKPRHVIGAILIVFVFILPNVWYAVDASIPYEDKYAYDQQIYALTPDFLRPANYASLTQNRNSFYLGAFGFSLPENKQYFPAAWKWFSTQDTEVAAAQRPAFLSWWDYGFEAADRGDHPTVADNFQNGYHLAGNVISAQSENEVIALLSLRLIEGDYWGHGRAFSPAVRAAIASFGIDPDTLLIAYREPDTLAATIKSNPFRYGYYDDNIQAENALYIYAGDILTSTLDTDHQADLYRAIREATGKDIGYFAVDSRLFPTSGSNTGIFYAPIKLSDHRVVNLRDGRVLPIDFFSISVTVRGQTIPIQNLGQFDRPDNPSGEITYKPMFYHSFFYRVYAGFEPLEVGKADDGIPGLSGTNAQPLGPLPAWNLTHWRVVYRTAYYNPFTDTQNHTQEWRAMNTFDALALQQNISAGKATGVVDFSPAATYSQGVLFARYYDGAFVNGTVTVGGATPVPGVHVTVADELGVPHDEATTDAEGRYSVLAPFGKVGVTFSTGAVDPRTMVGATPLKTLSFVVTEDAAMRRDVDADGDGVPDWKITRDITLPAATLSGRVYLDTNGNGQFDAGQDPPLAGATVRIQNQALSVANTTTADPAGRYELRDVYQGSTYVNVTTSGRTVGLARLNVPAAGLAQDLAVPGLQIAGSVRRTDGAAVPGAEVVAIDRTNGTTLRATADASGAYLVRRLLAGDFELTATSGDLSSLPAILTLGATSATGFNLTAYPGGTLQGTTFVGGNVQPFATVAFTNLEDRSLTRLVTSDASGRYSAALPVGRWSVTGRHYRGTDLFAALATVDVSRGSTIPFTAVFSAAAEVRGVAYSGNRANVSRGAAVTFRNDAGDVLLARTSNFGAYVVDVPTGTYDVQAILGSNAFQERRTFTDSTTFDLPLHLRTVSTGFVFRDVNRDGVREASEGVAGARVTLTDAAGQVLTLVTPANGSFAAPLDGAKTYRMDIDARGFDPVSRGPSSVSSLFAPRDIPLVARNVTVSGVLRWQGAPLTGTAVAIVFLAVGSGGVTQDAVITLQGGYSASLAPGEYQAIVDDNVSAGSDALRWQTASVERLTLDVGQGMLVHDMAVVQRARVTGSVTFFGSLVDVPVTFEGPDDLVVDTTAGRFSTYVATGTYTVYANRTQGPDTFIFSGTETITGPVDLSMPLVHATAVSGQVTVDGQVSTEPVTVVFTRDVGGVFRALSGPAGTYRVAVPDGGFTVSVDDRTTMTIAGVLRFVRVSFSGSLSVPVGATGEAYDVAATRTLDNSTVSGRVTRSGAGVAATVTFLAHSTGAMNGTATAAADGAYATALQPGSYSVHAVAVGGAWAFLGTLSVDQGADAAFDVPLAPAFAVTGVTTYKAGVRVSADLVFSAAADVHVKSDAATGAYAVVLPPATYAVTARTTTVENGIVIAYAKPTTLVLTGPPDPLNLALDRVARRSLKITWDSGQKTTIPAGASVTYAIVLTNTGNSEDEYAFSTVPAGWTFTFSPTRPRLSFGNGGNSTQVSVTIAAPADALVDHPDLTITARPAADTSVSASVIVQIGILARRSVSLTLSTATPTFDGRFLNYTLTISNRGNLKENLALVIPNLSELAARGWVARFAPPTGGDRLPEIRNFSVDGNATRTVTIVFESTGGGGGAAATVKAFAEDLQALESTVQFRLDLPVLGAGGRIDATGPNIVITQDLPYPLLSVIITIVACLAAGALLTMRRRRSR